MSAGLGQTNDPKRLIPGDVRSVEKTASALAAYGETLQLAGQGLSRIDTTDGWSGAAAVAFRKVYQGKPGEWTQAGNAFNDAATAVGNYSSMLSWAQGQAAYAIEVWNSGKANHQAAEQILEHAQRQLNKAGDTAAGIVSKAASQAPPAPGFWSQVGSFFSGVGHGAEAVGDDVVNGLASLGNAAIQDPGAVAATIGGLTLAGISAGGDAGGLVLDATGVGAVAGVPLNVVSTAGLVAGVGITAAGAGTLIAAAAGPDRVTILNASSGSGSGGGGEEDDPRDLTSKPGKIANETGYTRQQINNAIEAVKSQPGWRDYGGVRNPDVEVDLNTGEVYPKTAGGGVSDDSIGNIYDYLPDEPGN